LGHANYRVTYDVAKRARASSTPVDLTTAPPKCDACLLGKQTRTPVPKLREGVRSSEKGDTFYVDPAGQQCTRSAAGNLYTLDIIDDFSSYGWSYPVAAKSDCGPRLRAFIIARRAEGLPVRRIVLDNGECVTSDIRAHCSLHLRSQRQGGTRASHLHG
ncbi:hypothetical protein PYCCODRAFT_1370885, partial [Trametes coccinea BRFM310]